MSHIDSSKELVSALIIFLSDKSELYVHLTDTAKVLIEKEAKEDVSMLISATFLLKDGESLVDRVIAVDNKDLQRVDADCWMRFIDSIDGNDRRKILGKGIEVYGASADYNDADNNSNKFIKPYIDMFTKEELDQINSHLRDTYQVSSRRRAPSDRRMINDALCALDANLSESN